MEHKLANRLTVLMLVERHRTPVVSLNMTFGVGESTNRRDKQLSASLRTWRSRARGRLGRKITGKRTHSRRMVSSGPNWNSGNENSHGRVRKDPQIRGSSSYRGAAETIYRTTRSSGTVRGRREMAASTNATEVGLNAATGKDLTRYVIASRQIVCRCGLCSKPIACASGPP